MAVQPWLTPGGSRTPEAHEASTGADQTAQVTQKPRAVRDLGHAGYPAGTALGATGTGPISSTRATTSVIRSALTEYASFPHTRPEATLKRYSVTRSRAMGYKNVTHRYLVCDWCRKEEEYPENQDAKHALPDWLIGRTHYETSRGNSPVTLCPGCSDIYNIATEGTSTPAGERFRAIVKTYFDYEDDLKKTARINEPPNLLDDFVPDKTKKPRYTGDIDPDPFTDSDDDDDDDDEEPPR
ncbi:hypothetical protein GJ25_gp099 [Mycobacterium phage Hawkeye]|uniref:Uncharacterized protein n=1 Tax=Mycobacterium phage Hawkeye TaxID=1458711 RepID=X2KT67_9CAUD|nr:hypothetical protein GJ25_gp099 [Mycobacterium phage Hawkeye]AHN84110.1 hypothetical protein PBI_HAWKEYE_99 [Mycobacterium phage Hawkeye]